MQIETLIKIFYNVDNFCKIYKHYCKKHHLTDDTKRLSPKCSMELSEIMTILIYFHLSGMRTFKWYYVNYVSTRLKPYFPRLLSYNRFVELMPCTIVPFLLYTSKFRFGKSTGINFIDSTFLDVCDNRRIYCHKVFKDFAKRGKGSTGWHYGFKLHLVINDRGEILSFCLTPGNVDDRNINVIEHLSKTLFGKLFGDRGYISQKLFEHLFKKSITLVTKIKRKMKNKLMDLSDKILLRKRAIIESVNDFLKNICQIEHTRHRSVNNFYVNVISGLAAYSFLPKKPSLNISSTELIG